MKIRKPKHITPLQFLVVTAVGVIGGVYIYKPLFERYWFDKRRPKQEARVPGQE